MINSGSLRQLGSYLRTHWVSAHRIRFWLLILVMVLVIVYTVLGFFGVPWLIQYRAVNTAREVFGRELRIEAVPANPFTLTLQIKEFALDDPHNRL